MIAMMKNMRTMVLTMYSTMSGTLAQVDETSEDVTAMGRAFDEAKNDDTFFLPPEVFENADFQRAMNSFLSPDGKAARFIISHNGDPATPEGIARINKIRTAAEEALKGTPLVNAKIYHRGRRVDREGLAVTAPHTIYGSRELQPSALFSSSC